MKKLIIVANRLPVKITSVNRELKVAPSEGGLATGLGSLETDHEVHWIGWPGIPDAGTELEKKITDELAPYRYHPVFYSAKEHAGFYAGYSNKTLWPLFHYFIQYTSFNESYFELYEKVNRLFCHKVKEIARPGDIIWIQDYQLMLLPAMLRELMPDNPIGFFLHIPFPSHEVFRILPERKKLLEGLLGANLIGFHTFEYMRHFIYAATTILGIEHNASGISYEGRNVYVDSFPMGINFQQWFDAGKRPKVNHHLKIFKERIGSLRMIFSVDRLDYTKGILHRLKGYDHFLSSRPELHGKIMLFLLVVPSRDMVDNYRSLKKEIDLAVGEINGRYSSIGWSPVQYVYRAFSFDQLAALYQLADVALVTPLRDGMNLVAKEYIASRQKQDGVLILSEMAGASIELPQAIKVNPYSMEDVAAAISAALEMPADEQHERMESMQSRLKKQTVNKWADDFISRLNRINRSEETLHEKVLEKESVVRMKKEFAGAGSKLLLLDYDGTLVPFRDDPGAAVPDADLLQIITGLCKLEDTSVVIISGRDHLTLEKWFSNIPVEMIAEHGTYFRENNRWKRQIDVSDAWKQEIRSLLIDFCDKTPGSFIEEKNLSLVWHYRKVNSWLADLRREQLIRELMHPISRSNLQVLKGNKVLEVRVRGVDKGTATQHWLEKRDWDFILALGDDVTDEDIFRNLQQNDWSIKVGMQQSAARFSIPDWKHARKLLSSLSGLTTGISDKKAESVRI